MSRQRRGSARRPTTARPTGSAPETPGARQAAGPAREAKHDGRVRAGYATRGPGGRRGGFSPGWLLAGAAAVALAAVALLTLPRLLGGASGSASPAGGGLAGCPTAQPPALPAGETRIATITTELGEIEIQLEADLSPIAVGNFVALAECGFYDGVVFHRTPTLQDGTPFVIQGGDPDGTGRGGPGYEIQDEPVTRAYERGVVAMARTQAPNSVGSQFFIVLSDGARPALESANTYQIIGTVTEGMDVADAIHARAGGQELPTDPVVMQDVTISEASGPGGTP